MAILRTLLIYEFVGLCICRNTGSRAEPPPVKTNYNCFYIFQNCIIHNFGRILNSPAILFEKSRSHVSSHQKGKLLYQIFCKIYRTSCRYAADGITEGHPKSFYFSFSHPEVANMHKKFSLIKQKKYTEHYTA